MAFASLNSGAAGVGRFEAHTYEGDYDDQDRYEGRGRLTAGNTVYEGEFRAGKMEGIGKLVQPYGDEYEGGFLNGLYHGKGVLVSKKHYGLLVEKYEGNFEHGMKSGHGKLLLSNSATYEGSFLQGKFHGKGIYKSGPNQLSGRNGYSYDGQWDTGKIHGTGTESYPSGARYEGQFSNGRKHGFGSYSGNGLTNGGYNYNGQWVHGIRQGLGIEINRPIERIEAPVSPGNNPTSPQSRQQRNDLRLPFLYEGEFWNNKRHGTGRYISENGQIYYGGWVNGMKWGLGCEINPITRSWDLKIFQSGEYVSTTGIKGDSDMLGDVFKGYDYWMEKVHQGSESGSGEPFDDKEFAQPAKRYPHFDPQKMQEAGIDINALKYLRLRDIYPEKMVCLPIPAYQPVKIELPRFYDQQLLPFLYALLKNPQNTLDVLNHSTVARYLFFCFNMYFQIKGHVLKTFIAVDDSLPLSQDGVNLFAQLERGENVILPMLEKAWYKYANICDLRESLHRSRGRYIDKVMFAYLGCPSISLQTSSPDFMAQLQKYYYRGAYIFCYLRETPNKPSKYSNMPFQMVELIHVHTGFNSASRAPEAFVLQTIDLTHSPGKTERVELADPMSHGKYLVDKESGYFISHLPDFLAHYSEVRICLFDPELRTQYCISSTPIDQVKEIGFEEFYFTARIPVNDKVKICVVQDHEVLDEGAAVELLADYFGSAVKELNQRKNPPVRLVLARSPLLDHRKLARTSDSRSPARGDGPSLMGVPNDADPRKLRPKGHKKHTGSKTPETPNPLALLGGQGNLEDSLESIEQSSDEDMAGPKGKKVGQNRNKTNKKLRAATDLKGAGLQEDKEQIETVAEGYRRKFKYVDGLGQSTEQCLVLQERLMEAGAYTLMVQVQANKVYTDKLKNLHFKIVAQSRSGSVYFEPCTEKPQNFLQNVFSELALRPKQNPRPEEKPTQLVQFSPEGKHKWMFQHFSANENIYTQLFVNLDSNHIWIHKLRPAMNNMEVIGVKNQKKPVELRIEPFQEKVVLIQQINAAEFEFIGGEGDFTLQKIKKV